MTWTPMRALRVTRWIILLCALAMGYWITTHYSVVRPNAPKPGMWSYYGDRLVVVERLEGAPDKGRVICFYDDKDRVRLGTVIGHSGDVMENREGVLYLEGQETLFSAQGPPVQAIGEGYVLVAPDDPNVLAHFGDPLVVYGRVIGQVMVEFLF